ncbi:hypothetical protein RJ639_014348 [Escallonia herrerae]|uniref:PB1 domain-containing protein n=1 Tax=Escallonia herrerae TaxID=1293975 RepID=A0AA88VGP6_9ASTE|nr:hypothetical protein RJ639_014348 [Escallonia herrerae]
MEKEEKVKLMFSYGGKIQARPHDNQLVYAGGDTKIMTVDRTVGFHDIVAKLNGLFGLNSSQFCLKYQLPGEGLDSLVSLIDDDDLVHMMFEYDRLHRISSKPARIRLFMFPLNRLANPQQKAGDAKPETPRIPEPETKTVAARPEAPPIPDFLFGFDKEYEINSMPPNVSGSVSRVNYGSDPINGAAHDYPRDGNVTSNMTGGGYVCVPAPYQYVYRIPVPAGAYQYGGMHVAAPASLAQPHYNFFPVMSSVLEQKVPVGTHLAVNGGEGFAAAAGAGSMQPAVAVEPPSKYEAKVPLT